MYRRGCCLHISSEMDCVEITDRHEVGVSDSDEDGQGVVAIVLTQRLPHQNVPETSLGKFAVVWTPDPSGPARKGLGNNPARKCLHVGMRP